MSSSLLAESVDEYYRSDPAREERLQQVLNRQAGFSLRDIDWYVTNMSARKPQIFRHRRTGRIVDVNSDYKDVLRCYHKASFDSFKRRGPDTKDDLKQRNFFRWALENGIVDHVAENIQEIKDDMSEMKKKRQQDEDVEAKNRKRRRKEDYAVDSAFTGTTFVLEPKELKIPNLINIIW